MKKEIPSTKNFLQNLLKPHNITIPKPIGSTNSYNNQGLPSLYHSSSQRSIGQTNTSTSTINLMQPSRFQTPQLQHIPRSRSPNISEFLLQNSTSHKPQRKDTYLEMVHSKNPHILSRNISQNISRVNDKHQPSSNMLRRDTIRWLNKRYKANVRLKYLDYPLEIDKKVKLGKIYSLIIEVTNKKPNISLVYDHVSEYCFSMIENDHEIKLFNLIRDELVQKVKDSFQKILFLKYTNSLGEFSLNQFLESTSSDDLQDALSGEVVDIKKHFSQSYEDDNRDLRNILERIPIDIFGIFIKIGSKFEKLKLLNQHGNGKGQCKKDFNALMQKYRFDISTANEASQQFFRYRVNKLAPNCKFKNEKLQSSRTIGELPDISMDKDTPNSLVWLSKFKLDGTFRNTKNRDYLNKIGIPKSSRIAKWEKILNTTTKKTARKAKKEAQYAIDDMKKKGRSERMTFRKKSSPVLKKNSSSKILEKKQKLLERPFSLKRSKSGLTLNRALLISNR